MPFSCFTSRNSTPSPTPSYVRSESSLSLLQYSRENTASPTPSSFRVGTPPLSHSRHSNRSSTPPYSEAGTPPSPRASRENTPSPSPSIFRLSNASPLPPYSENLTPTPAYTRLPLPPHLRGPLTEEETALIYNIAGNLTPDPTPEILRTCKSHTKKLSSLCDPCI